jgi:predicted O-methyltransferase YrrM
MNTPNDNQITHSRIPGMEKVIKEFNRPINMLEIGTWCGQGSTQIWLNELHPGSTITLLDSWKPYCQNDYNDEHFNYKDMDNRMTDAYIKTFNAVKSFESIRDDIKISIIRCDSKTYLNNFADETFDFIYIDGAHYYENVKSDIQQAKRLIKKCGIISGDDYEHDASFKLDDGSLAFPLFLEVAKQYPNNDFVSIPNTRFKIHPGVLLALNEEFDSKVLNHDGFWWVYVDEGNYTLNTPINI